MGNYQTSNNTFNTYGDNNSFAAEGGLKSTNAASLDVDPGKSNPGGYIFQVTPGLIESQSISVGNLSLQLGSDGQPLVVVTNAGYDVMDKLTMFVEMWRPMLEAAGMMACYMDFKKYVVLRDGYVGTTKEMALRNYVEGAKTMELTMFRDIGRTYSTLFGQIGQFDRDVQSVLALFPIDTPYGKLSGDLQSMIKMAQRTLSPKNKAMMYPEAALEVIAKISPSLRTKSKELATAQVMCVNLFEPVFSVQSSNQISLSAQNAVRANAKAAIAASNIPLITSDAPVQAKALHSGTPSQTYNIRMINPAKADYVSQMSSLPGELQVTIKNKPGTKTWTVVLGPKTRALHLDDMSSMAIDLDLGGESYASKQPVVNPDGMSVGFILLVTTTPLEEIVDQRALKSMTLVSTVKLKAEQSSIEDAVLIQHTAVSYLFDRRDILADKTENNHYLLSQLLFTSKPQAGYKQQDAWAGVTTMQSLDTDIITVKGREVDTVVPTSAIGNYTPDELTVALPNDLHRVMKRHLEHAAAAASSVDDETQDGLSTLAYTAAGRLVADSIPAKKGDPAQNIKFKEIVEESNKAITVFKRSPEQALMLGSGVLGNKNNVQSILTGLETAVNSKSLATQTKDGLSNLSAMQSAQAMKQGILDNISRLFPSRRSKKKKERDSEDEDLLDDDPR